jgi:hypothetical protein
LQHQQLRAEISVEHTELGHVLSGEMPGLEQRLRDQNIPLASVIVRDQSAGTPGGFSQSSQQQRQPAAPPSPAVFAGPEVRRSTVAEEIAVSRRALDLHI